MKTVQPEERHMMQHLIAVTSARTGQVNLIDNQFRHSPHMAAGALAADVMGHHHHEGGHSWMDSNVHLEAMRACCLQKAAFARSRGHRDVARAFALAARRVREHLDEHWSHLRL